MNHVVTSLTIGFDKNQPLHGSKLKVHISAYVVYIVVLLEQTGPVISLCMCTAHPDDNLLHTATLCHNQITLQLILHILTRHLSGQFRPTLAISFTPVIRSLSGLPEGNLRQFVI